MRQRFALIGVKQHNIARFGLRFAQLLPQADAVDFSRVLAPFQRVP
jgi:hypothetical protein